MTRTQIRALIRKELGETTAAFWSDTELNDWINNAGDDTAYKTKSIRTSGYVTTTASTGEYTLSTLFPTLLSVMEVYYYQNAQTWQKLGVMTRDTLSRLYSGWKSADAGCPMYYYWDPEENVLGFYVKPDATNAGSNRAQVYYAQKYTAMSNDTDTPNLPEYLHMAMVYYVVQLGYQSRGWGDKANDAGQKYLSRLQDYMVERERAKDFDEPDGIVMRPIRNIQ
jgi:hypothetical protein